MKDDVLASRFQIRQNYNYFLDVAKKAAGENDHNTAIMIRCALMHHAVANISLKKRKKNKEIIEYFDNLYGTTRNVYKQHLLSAMNNVDYQFYIPSLMVLLIHYKRHIAFAQNNKYNLMY